MPALLERTTNTGRVDHDAGVIRGVKVLGRVSKRGRRYSDQAFHDGRELYEGIEVAVDHPPEEESYRPRRVADVIGVLENVRVRITGDDAKDGVYADLRLMKSHSLYESVLERAERFPKTIGLSHNASGAVHEVDGVEHVERLNGANTVDLVTKPATNEGLFEGLPSGGRLLEMDTGELIPSTGIVDASTGELDPMASDLLERLRVVLHDDSLPPEQAVRDARDILDELVPPMTAMESFVADLRGKSLVGDGGAALARALKGEPRPRSQNAVVAALLGDD